MRVTVTETDQPNEDADAILTTAAAVPFRTAADRATEIRALRASANRGREALRRLHDRLGQAGRSDREYDHNAAVRDVQAATVQVLELRRLVGLGPLTDG